MLGMHWLAFPNRARMITSLVLYMLFAGLCFAECNPTQSVCYLSSNFSADLYGQLDTRPNTWGYAAAHQWTITFKQKEVRLLSAAGDVVAWPTTKGLRPVLVQPGTFAGVLFGLMTTEPEGSRYADWAADNTFVYIQGAVSNKPIRMQFNRTFNVHLEDGKVVVRLASWLNDTGYAIHIEPTFTLGYTFKKGGLYDSSYYRQRCP